ncbi:MAG TPA: hypothetical protein VE685_21505 [Thermoanaerobaculia bacterium]|nr:hypothetical protein [Thermoanaerobaculia bacterium]
MPFLHKPEREEIERLAQQLTPRLVQVLEGREISEDDAASLLSGVLIRLMYRWNSIPDREHWVLSTFEAQLRRYLERC